MYLNSIFFCLYSFLFLYESLKKKLILYLPDKTRQRCFSNDELKAVQEFHFQIEEFLILHHTTYSYKLFLMLFILSPINL